MPTYRELFRNAEYRALFGGWAAQIGGGTLSGLALSTLVYAATGSPLLSALSLFGPSFAQVIGATTMLSAADRLRPRATLATVALITSACTFILAVPSMPVVGILVITLFLGLVNSVATGVRWGLLGEIVAPENYILARSVFSTSLGIMQITGYVVGGILVATLSARWALLLSGGFYLVTSLVMWFGLSGRPPRATGRPSVAQTWRGNRRIWSVPGMRHVYLAMWIPNGLIVGCEALFVPYSPSSAGALFISMALGMLAGDILVARLVPKSRRAQVITPLRLLLATPFLLFALQPGVPVACVVIICGALGFSAGLLLQDRLVNTIPSELRGQALGLHTSGLLTMQAVGATIAGAVASFVSVGAAMAIMAAASLVISVALIPGLRRPVVPRAAEPAVA